MTNYNLDGEPIKPRQRRERDVLSAKGKAVLARAALPVPEGIRAVWDLMAELGITPQTHEYVTVAEKLAEIDDYPVDWIPALKARAIELDVTNPLTIARWAVASQLRGVAPGKGKEQAQEQSMDMSDEAIMAKYAALLDRACQCGSDWCEMNKAILKEMVG